DQKRQSWVDRRCGEDCVDIVKGFRVAEKRGGAEFRIEDLVRRGVEERPRHEEAEDERKAAVSGGLGHEMILHRGARPSGSRVAKPQGPAPLIPAPESPPECFGVAATGPSGAPQPTGSPHTSVWHPGMLHRRTSSRASARQAGSEHTNCPCILISIKNLGDCRNLKANGS